MTQDRTTDRPNTDRARTLRHALAQLDLSLGEPQQQQLIAYLDLLAKWNRTYNLTAIRDPRHMLTHHLFDCLSVVPIVKQILTGADRVTEIKHVNPTLVDVGSGAGLPGLILAIACPQLQVTVIDAVEKKHAFMAQVINELALRNAQARHIRIQDYRPVALPDVITSRAYSSLAQFAADIAHLASPTTVALAMKGKRPDEELANLPRDWQPVQIEPLVVPGLDAERSVVRLRKS